MVALIAFADHILSTSLFGRGPMVLRKPLHWPDEALPRLRGGEIAPSGTLRGARAGE